jgi:hypothetical protein
MRLLAISMRVTAPITIPTALVLGLEGPDEVAIVAVSGAAGASGAVALNEGEAAIAEQEAAQIAQTTPQLAPQQVCAAESITAPFRSGDIIIKELSTSKGPVEMAAETVIDGKNLLLKDIALYPKGADSLELGAKEVLALMNQLAAEAKAMGFEQLRITGIRLTGANPGKLVDVIIDLTQ